jgi:ubiquinone/menaquinone biosynthesis C-methylase UbiE
MLTIIRQNRIETTEEDRIPEKVWEYLKGDGKKVLDIGCGKSKLAGALGMDCNPRSDADIFGDLEIYPYLFPDQAFDEVRAVSVIEHLDNILMTMEELHRITKTKGILKITVPFFASRYFHTDFTHKHSFGSRSFDYFDPSEQLSRYEYSSCKFRKLKVEYEPLPNIYRRDIERPLVRLANWKKDFYENYLAYYFPMHDIYFELEVLR